MHDDEHFTPAIQHLLHTVLENVMMTPFSDYRKLIDGHRDNWHLCPTCLVHAMQLRCIYTAWAQGQ